MTPLLLLVSISLAQAAPVKVDLGKIPALEALKDRPIRGTAPIDTKWGEKEAQGGAVWGHVLDDGKKIGEFQLFAGSLQGPGRDWYALLETAPIGGQVEFHAKRQPQTFAPIYTWTGDWKTERKLSDSRGPVLSIFCEPYDSTSEATKDATFKTFTQLYDPEGKELITKGAGGKFPHHRGLFYGFMKTTYKKGQVDTWHCKEGVHLNLTGEGKVEEGWLGVRITLPVGWYGKKGDLFANEERQFTVFHRGESFVVDFDSRLTPVEGTIKVDGDPQHAGFHFRASGEVADKTSGETVYLRPSGPDKPGVERNWPQTKEHINLPWNVMQFTANGQRYSATYVNHPANPGESRFSERNYGRFGCYFVAEATKDKPLTVQYRIVARRGAIDQPTAQADRDAFAR